MAAGSPETVAETTRAELATSEANYLVGQRVFGDMSSGEAKNSVALFIEKVMPELALMEI